MDIQLIQHVPYEGPGQIKNWLKNRNHNLSYANFFETYSIDDPKDFDGLIIMGGPMGTYEEEKYPWLVREKNHIDQYIREQKPVLGVCLGAQLIVDVLGGQVYEGPNQEIGWFPVMKTEKGTQSDLLKEWPNSEIGFHWHGDTYDLPDGATNLMTSEKYENQLFEYEENVVGIQYHLEMKQQGIERLLQKHHPGPNSNETVQDISSIRDRYFLLDSLHVRMVDLLDRVFVV